MGKGGKGWSSEGRGWRRGRPYMEGGRDGREGDGGKWWRRHNIGHLSVYGGRELRRRERKDREGRGQ